MPSLTSNSLYLLRRTLPFYVVILILSGCAVKPWGDPLLEEEADAVITKIKSAHQMTELQSWDADLTITLETSLETKRFEGYLQTLPPSSFKFVSSNPLGQPILAVYSNGERFQLLDVLNTQYTHGSTSAYAHHASIPEDFVSGSWSLWMAGMIPENLWESPVLSSDKQGRGVWLSSTNQDYIDEASVHYLISLETLLMEEQQIYDSKGKLLATFKYDDYTILSDSLQPTEILIADLPFGTKIRLSLSAIQHVEALEQKDLMLPVPQHYFIRYLP